MYCQEYGTGHYVLKPTTESDAMWRGLYFSWYALELRSQEVDDGFQFTFPKFIAYLQRLKETKCREIESKNVVALFRRFSRFATHEFKRIITAQTWNELTLDGDVAEVIDEAEPDSEITELQLALKCLSCEELDLIQTSILFSNYYRKGFYRKLAEYYFETPDAIRGRYRKALRKIRRILDSQKRISCFPSSDGEPDT